VPATATIAPSATAVPPTATPQAQAPPPTETPLPLVATEPPPPPPPTEVSGRAPGETRTITTTDQPTCYQLGQADGAQDRAAGVLNAGCWIGPGGDALCSLAYLDGYMGDPFTQHY
jgi:hypothetical protein